MVIYQQPFNGEADAGDLEQPSKPLSLLFSEVRGFFNRKQCLFLPSLHDC